VPYCHITLLSLKCEQLFLLFRKDVFMNYSKIYYCDIANGTGVRTSLFVSGCRNHCIECFNKETWDFSHGEPFDEEVQKKILSSISPSYVEGISILGGEPMEPENQEALLPFLLELKKALPKKTVWIYTGFTFEELFDEKKRCCTEYTKGILSTTDILVDGPFLIEKKNISLAFRGSENQRIIDVKETLLRKKVVLSPLMQ